MRIELWGPGRANGGSPTGGAGGWKEDRLNSTLLLPTNGPTNRGPSVGSPRDPQQASKEIVEVCPFYA